MPSSTPASEPGRARGFLAAAGLTLVVALALVAGRVVWFDAYWLFRREPPWLAATGGSNRLLDDQTRRGKVLQALDRDYALALIGSSTTYNGLDPSAIDAVPQDRIFNVGISAIIADELPVVASVVASKPGVTRVTLGLDYYMFSRPEVPVALDPALATPTGRLTARLGSLISRYAIADAWLPQVAGGDAGRWTRAGFHVNPVLTPTLTRDVNATRLRLTVPYRPESLQGLDLALRRLAPRRIDVYLSPVSDAQRRVLASLGLTGDFERWRADTARVTAARGIALQDLTELGARYPFDPNEGSNAAWFDNLHFTPLIGRIVLERLGLRGAESRQGPSG